MSVFDFKLDADHSLILPVIGDAEIRRIEFEFPNLRLHIVQPFDGQSIELFLADMRFLFFHTDHPQNVIDKVFVYDSWESVRLPPEADANTLKKEFGSDDGYLVVIESIAGGPLVCGARGFTVHAREP